MVSGNLEIFERIVKWFNGEPQSPFKLEIWPSYSCNLRCKFCSSWMNRGLDRLEEYDALRLLKDSNDFGVKEFFISGGGEPLVRKDLVLKSIKKAKEYGMMGNMITNGTLLEEDDIRLLVDVGWDSLVFSLDGHSPEVHDYHRGMGGTFKKVKKNIELINEIKKEKGKEFPHVLLMNVLTRHNLPTLKNFIELGKSLKAEQMMFLSLMDADKHPDMRIDDLAGFNEKIREAIEFSKSIGVNTGLDIFLDSDYIEYSNDAMRLFLKDVKGNKGILAVPCYDPWYVVSVNHEGKMAPCPCWTGKSTIDISSNLESAWYGQEFNNIRRNIANQDMRGCMCCTQKVFDARETRNGIMDLLAKSNSRGFSREI